MSRALAVALFALLSTSAFADGGQIILHRISGGLEITVFAAPTPLTTGRADFSILVQDIPTQQPVTGVNPILSLQPPQGAAITLHPDQPSHQLMQSVQVNLDQPGRWTISVAAGAAGAQTVGSAQFDVSQSRSRATIVWFAVLVPLVVIVLFGLHQRQKAVTSARRVAREFGNFKTGVHR